QARKNRLTAPRSLASPFPFEDTTMPNTPIQAAGEAMLSAETPHEKIRRLSWRIADLLNGLDPRIDYVTICASGSGAHAVMTGFNIPFGGEDDIETLFHRW